MNKLEEFLLSIGFIKDPNLHNYYNYYCDNISHIIIITNYGNDTTNKSIYFILNDRSFLKRREFNIICNIVITVDRDIEYIKLIPEFEDIIKYAHRKNIINKILTNG